MTLNTNHQLTTVVSYPERGQFGNSQYRGNCSGYVIKDLLEYFNPESVLDPAEGSGTTGDVCRELGITYTGYDLRKGFDLVSDEIQGKYDFVFFHPPYWDVVLYSNNPRDLSRSPTYNSYMERLKVCITKLHESLLPSGVLAILIGDKKKNGKLYTFFNDIICWQIGMLFQIIIKLQHNTMSASKSYSGRFIPICHEYILLFRKEATNEWL